MNALFSLGTGPGALRLILAALVVASHMSNLEIGRPAVFVFFALSGYWVLRMYDEKYAGQASLGVFYLSRGLRIWLSFATAFALAFALLSLAGHKIPLSHLGGLLVFGVASTGQDVLGTAWSLDIEMQFYLAVPLIWLALRDRDPLAPGLLVLWAGLTALGWGLQLRFGVWTVLSYLPAFLAGVWIWRARPQVTGRTAALSLAVFVGLGLVVAALPGPRALFLKDVASPLNEDWFGLAWTLTLVPFLAWNVARPSPALDRHLGGLSYPLYILHWPVIVLAGTLMGPLSALDKLAVLAAIFALATVFYGAIDRRWEGLRLRLVAAARTRPASGRRSAAPQRDLIKSRRAVS